MTEQPPYGDNLDEDALHDGRQSETAMRIMRGVSRMLAGQNFASLPEVTLPNHRRADLLAIGPRGEIWIIEIKSSLTDFQTDKKWPDYLDYCDSFFFAVEPDFPTEHLPEACGLILADAYGAEIIRTAPGFQAGGGAAHGDNAARGACRRQPVAKPVRPTSAGKPENP